MAGSLRKLGLRRGIGLSLVSLTVFGATLFATRRPSSEPIEIFSPTTPPPTSTPAPSPTPRLLYVDVAGAVRRPGVYRLPPESRVDDAIAIAGGASDQADLDRINQAEPLQDGIQVYVPSVLEPGPTPDSISLPSSTERPAASTGADRCILIDVNAATLAELDQLPGIGPAMAALIVQGRPYGAIDDLLRVKGIGPATLEKLRPCAVVR